MLIKKNNKNVYKSLINKFIYINKDANLIPFKIINLTSIKNNLKIELEDIDNQNSASKYIGMEIYLNRENISVTKTTDDPQNILGYQIIENKKVLGIVEDYYEKKIQPIITTKINNKEILIPYDNNIIYKIDSNMKKIYVNLPRGLLDI